MFPFKHATEEMFNSYFDHLYKLCRFGAYFQESDIELLEKELMPWIANGLSGAIYTQTTDVEGEVNGYLTYDREVVKMDVDKITAVHKKILKD